MPNYRHTIYGAGQLAYVDSFAGLIPCTVVNVEIGESDFRPETIVTVKINATRRDYRRGEILTVAEGRVIPRDKIRVRSGQYKILMSFAWVPGITGAHPLHSGPCAEGIGPGDALIVNGNYGIVTGVTIHPRGHDLPTVKPDYLALEIRTTAGTRYRGATRAEIRGDLRVHYGIDGFDCIDGMSRD